jgi:hypothetical protein
MKTKISKIKNCISKQNGTFLMVLWFSKIPGRLAKVLWSSMRLRWHSFLRNVFFIPRDFCSVLESSPLIHSVRRDFCSVLESSMVELFRALWNLFVISWIWLASSWKSELEGKSDPCEHRCSRGSTVFCFQFGPMTCFIDGKHPIQSRINSHNVYEQRNNAEQILDFAVCISSGFLSALLARWQKST